VKSGARKTIGGGGTARTPIRDGEAASSITAYRKVKARRQKRALRLVDRTNLHRARQPPKNSRLIV